MLKMKSIICTIYCIFGIVVALDFPSYIPRCSLSDPNLNACIKEKANIAIPNVAKGDEKVGIPVMTPVQFPKAKLEGKNLVIDLTNPASNNFKDAKMTDIVFDLEKQKTDFTLVIDDFNVLGEYSITDGKVLDHSISGSGKINMKLTGLTLKCGSDLLVSEKDGEKYLAFADLKCKMGVKRGHYVFENLKSSEEGEDANAFIDEHWEVLNAETTPPLESYFALVINGALDPILKAFSLNKLFLQ